MYTRIPHRGPSSRPSVLIVNIKYVRIAVEEGTDMKRKLLLAGTLLLAAAVTLGCSSKSDNPAGPDAPVYLLRTSPGNVIANVEVAYEEMDVEEYLDCLSLDFIFYPAPEDTLDPWNGIPPMWYKTDEAAMHETMFGDSSGVQSISLTLTLVDTVFHQGDPSDLNDNIWIYTCDVDLRVTVPGPLMYMASTPSQFHMRVDTDQAGPFGQPLWEIYKWYDLGDSGAACDSPREDYSWGRVKAIFWER